jgi:regulator of cell morphogenesis and NO signaling
VLSRGSVESPIAAMIADHEDEGAILSKIRVLTNGFAEPAGACPTFRALYGALEEFERDLHWHVHLENNILFPRAIAAVREFRSAPASAR